MLFSIHRVYVIRSKDDGVAIYSVGPNGKDDGGPGPQMDNDQPKNDDVGIFLRKSPPL